jgi:hypothetical protein
VARDESQVSVGGLLEQECLGVNVTSEAESATENNAHQKIRKTTVTKGKGRRVR